jgi:pimeloyl-ACP methyl ester carboxylesterase
MPAAEQAAARPNGDRGALFARQVGDGQPLVLLHGLLMSGEMFAPVADALAARHRLVIPDLRGHGRSAALPGPYDVERLAADVARLMDDLGIHRADVLGYSSPWHRSTRSPRPRTTPGSTAITTTSA